MFILINADSSSPNTIYLELFFIIEFYFQHFPKCLYLLEKECTFSCKTKSRSCKLHKSLLTEVRI